MRRDFRLSEPEAAACRAAIDQAYGDRAGTNLVTPGYAAAYCAGRDASTNAAPTQPAPTTSRAGLTAREFHGDQFFAWLQHEFDQLRAKLNRQQGKPDSDERELLRLDREWAATLKRIMT